MFQYVTGWHIRSQSRNIVIAVDKYCHIAFQKDPTGIKCQCANSLTVSCSMSMYKKFFELMDIGLLFYIDFVMNEKLYSCVVQTVLFLGPLIH